MTTELFSGQISLLKEMVAMSEQGGGVLYRGTKRNDLACVMRYEINGIEHGPFPTITINPARVLDPAPSQALYNHSPDGFEWGYSGSGPAQLALALLLDAGGDAVIALKYHQIFKEAFVAGWQDDWSIAARQIRAWVEMKKMSDLLRDHLREEPHE